MQLISIVLVIIGYIIGLNLPWWLIIIYVIGSQLWLESNYVRRLEIAALFAYGGVLATYVGVLIGIIVYLFANPEPLLQFMGFIRRLLVP